MVMPRSSSFSNSCTVSQAFGSSTQTMYAPAGRVTRVQRALVAARFEQLGHRELDQLVLAAARHELEQPDAVAPFAGLDPADLEAGAERLRERAAQHDVAGAVERLRRARKVVRGSPLELQLGVDVVLD